MENNYNKDNFTKEIVKIATLFTGNKKEIDHYTMQMLTGHSIFNKYRREIRKDVELRCWDCGDPEDDAEHVLFVCPKWISMRAELENLVGNLVEDGLRKDEQGRHDLLRSRVQKFTYYIFFIR